MNQNLDYMYEYCVKLFGYEKVTKKQYSNPEGIEIYITVDDTILSPVKNIELAIYRGEDPKSFMHLDDYTYEYDADEEKAIREMQKFVLAIKENRLSEKKLKVFGITVSKKLITV
jgi:hypothetical protein